MRENGQWLLDPTGAAGIPLLGDVSVTADAETYTPIAALPGPYTAEQPKLPLIFSPPVEFGPDATLAPGVVTAGAAANGIAAAGLDVCLLLRKTVS